MDALTVGLGRLGDRLSEKHQEERTRKADDWQRVQDEHPDVAQFITDVASVFGKPASVVVKTTEGDVILDSSRYK